MLERRDEGLDLLSNESLTRRNLQLLSPEDWGFLSIGPKLESRVSLTLQFSTAACE